MGEKGRAAGDLDRVVYECLHGWSVHTRHSYAFGGVFENQAELATILGGVPRIVLASLVAYSISQNIDVYLFTRLREKTNGKHLWLRSNVATITCQLLDTSVFFVIGFIGIMPIPDMVAATGTEFGVKIMMSIVGTPIIYLLVRWVRGNSRSTTQQPQYEVTHHTQIQ